MNAQEIIGALNGRWHGSYGTARCPAHDDRDPSLSVTDGEEGRTLVKCHAGCSQEAVQDALRARGLWGREIGSIDPIFKVSKDPLKTSRQDDAKRTAAAMEIWRAALSADGTLVASYLAARGIVGQNDPVLPPSLRFSTALKYAPSNLHLPAMIAAVQASDRRIVAIHRTYLDPRGDRKAAVSQQRLALGPISGGAVRLAHAGETLALTEGIEDALSLMQMTGQATWAVLGTSGFKNFQPPSAARTIVLAPDADSAGDATIADAAARFADMGLRVLHLRPPQGQDWNEVLFDYGERAAIREFDGGDRRTCAEFAAFAEAVGGSMANV